MNCPNCQRETQAGFFCHACDVYLSNPSVGSNAGIAARFGAQILDAISAWVVFFTIGVGSCVVGGLGTAVGGAGGGDQGPGALLGIGGFLGTFLVAFVGYIVFSLWFLAQGKTPGKWVLGIRVVDKNGGENPGLARMLVRETIGKMASGFFFVGYFWAIWDRDRQAWHDKIAGTLVVRQVAAAAQVTHETGVRTASQLAEVTSNRSPSALAESSVGGYDASEVAAGIPGGLSQRGKMIGTASLVLLLLAGFGWSVREARRPGTSGPDEAFLRSHLTAQLPAHVRLTGLTIQSSEYEGTAADPVFRTRFRGSLILTADTYVQSSVENGVVFVAPRLKEGEARNMGGVAVSRLAAGRWSTELSLDDNPFRDLGHPRSFFQAAKVIITGSPEEAAFMDEQRRGVSLAEPPQLQQQVESARQAQLEDARQQAQRIIAEAELEAQRKRDEAARLAETAREAATKKADEEARGREQTERVATADAERRQAEDAERRRQAEETPRFIEIPIKTEMTVRLSSKLNSGTAKVEDRFEATTVEDLRIGGRTVVPAGSVLGGVVASVQRATRLNRKAQMTLRFDQLTVNHRTYAINGAITQVISGPGIKGDVARTGAGATIGAIVGGILGGGKGAAIGAAVGGGGTLAATEGQEVEVAAGTVLRVRFEAPVQIQ